MPQTRIPGSPGGGVGGFFQRIVAWAKKHPVLAGVIAVGVVVAIYFLVKSRGETAGQAGKQFEGAFNEPNAPDMAAEPTGAPVSQPVMPPATTETGTPPIMPDAGIPTTTSPIPFLPPTDFGGGFGPEVLPMPGTDFTPYPTDGSYPSAPAAVPSAISNVSQPAAPRVGRMTRAVSQITAQAPTGAERRPVTEAQRVANITTQREQERQRQTRQPLRQTRISTTATPSTAPQQARGGVSRPPTTATSVRGPSGRVTVSGGRATGGITPPSGGRPPITPGRQPAQTTTRPTSPTTGVVRTPQVTRPPAQTPRPSRPASSGIRQPTTAAPVRQPQQPRRR